MSASAPVDGSSLCVSERSIVILSLCWVGRVVVVTTLGGPVGLAGARRSCGVVILWVEGNTVGIVGELYSWNRGVIGWIIIGTSVGGLYGPLRAGCVIGLCRSRLDGEAEDGWVRFSCSGNVGDGCMDGLWSGSVAGRLLFGILCSSRITAVLTSAIRWAPFHSAACILRILVGLRVAVVREGACVRTY